MASRAVDVAVIGAGQAGLATGYYLRRAGLVPGEDFVILDAAEGPGGAWPRMWDGLRLFSPSSVSSLPGWMMPQWDDAERGFPPRQHVVDYLSAYEQRYDLAPMRPHRVTSVSSDGADGRRLLLHAQDLSVSARVLVSATGTWDQPFWPVYPGAGEYAGRQLHASAYRRPTEFAGQRVAIVGGGNSAAQILAEVSSEADTIWVTTREPRFLPDDVDGHALFAAATERVRARERGGDHPGPGGLGDIVVVAAVAQARARGVLRSRSMFSRLTRTGLVWPEGTEEQVDAVIWCTGFRPALRHLAPLRLRERDGRVATAGAGGTRSALDPRVYLVGYGDWTGPASATLIGVGRTARQAVDDIVRCLGDEQGR